MRTIGGFSAHGAAWLPTYGGLPYIVLVMFVFTAPLHMLVADKLGYSVYAYVCFFLIGVPLSRFLFFAKQNGLWKVDIGGLSTNAIFLVSVSLLFLRFSPHVGVSRILGAVAVPYVIGLLYSRCLVPDKLGRVLYVGLLAKCLLLVAFAASYFEIYPKRPLFEGRAVYLWFGWGLDALACMLILKIQESDGTLIRLLLYAMLSILAFNLAGMNSRTLLLLAIGLASGAFFLTRSETARGLAGLIAFLLSIVFFVWLLPGRLDHISNMIQTLSCGAVHMNCDALAYVDKSTELRLEPIVSGEALPENYIFGDSVDNSNVTHLGGHFWPLAVLKFGGLLGITCFLALFGNFLLKSLRMTLSRRRGAIFLGLFALSFAAHILYVGNIFNNPVLFLIMGFVLNAVKPHDKNSDRSNFISKNGARP